MPLLTSKSAGRATVKRHVRMEIKEISAAGEFEGLLSPYGNVDQGGDVVMPGAYTKTLQEHGNTVPMLWQHKQDTPIGELTLEDRPEGLWCKGKLLMELPEAQKAYLLIKAKIVRGLSIGFDAIKDAIENGVRKLKEIRLFEGSIVTFPMNESALIASVKSRGRETKGDFNEELAERQLYDAGYQMDGALWCALRSLVWADLTRDEKITAAEACIEQFHGAYMAYFPAYLDMLTEEYGEMETWSAKRFEVKSGRMISAANKETIKSACTHMKSAGEILLALIEDEAVVESDDTSKSAAAAPETKSEPVDHSALANELKSLTEKLTWNSKPRSAN